MTIQTSILFALSAYVMGYIAAIPIGATQIEIAKRMINGYTSSAVMIVAGAVTSDFTYGIIAMFGIAPFLQYPAVVAYFSIANALILIILGILTFRQSKTKISSKQETKDFLLKKRASYITGLMLAVANPLIIYWWLLGSRFLGSIYRLSAYSVSDIFLFLVSGALGIASYPLSMLLGIHKTKKFFTEKTVMKTTFVFAIALFVLAAYFLYEGLKFFVIPLQGTQ